MQLKFEEMENDPSSTRNTLVSPEEDEPEEDGVADVVEDFEHLERLEDEAVGGVSAEEVDEEEEFGNHEISVLSRQLDQLQSALDVIESRNDNIHKVLLEILHSNREVRKELKERGVPADAVQDDSVDDNDDGIKTLETLENETENLFDMINEVVAKVEKL